MGLRQDRLADEIRDLVASSLMGGRMDDPRLQSVAITAVKVTADLQLATVYFRVYGDDSEIAVGKAAQGLDAAAGFFRRKLAKALDIRRVPELRFFYDKSVEHGSNIENLLRNLT